MKNSILPPPSLIEILFSMIKEKTLPDLKTLADLLKREGI